MALPHWVTCITVRGIVRGDSVYSNAGKVKLQNLGSVPTDERFYIIAMSQLGNYVIDILPVHV